MSAPVPLIRCTQSPPCGHCWYCERATTAAREDGQQLARLIEQQHRDAERRAVIHEVFVVEMASAIAAHAGRKPAARNDTPLSGKRRRTRTRAK